MYIQCIYLRKLLPKSSRNFAKIHKRDSLRCTLHKILQHFLLSPIVLAIDWGLNDPVGTQWYDVICEKYFFYFFLSFFFMAWHRKNGYIYKRGFRLVAKKHSSIKRQTFSLTLVHINLLLKKSFLPNTVEVRKE